MTFRVLVADDLPQEGLQAFGEYEGVTLDDRAGISREELLEVIGGYQGLVVRSRTEVDTDVIAAGKSLQVIGRAGIGVDNVDVPAATRAGVVVMNTPDGNAITTAEHTLALIFSLTRHIPQATASMKAGKWEKKAFLGQELSGKTLGMVGLGNIGKIVADRAQGLRMNVVAYDPYFDAEAAAKLGVELMPLENVLRQADILTVHTPLTDETRGLISDGEIDMMKPGVLLVNCARGGIYDEDALLRGLQGGKIGGVALDVFVKEPPGDHPLLKEPKVICTPHLGASTTEAQIKVAVDIAKQIGEFAGGAPARNAVNLPRISAGELRALGPYLVLAERMGAFLAQLHTGPLTRIEVELGGEVAERSPLPVSNAVVSGALQHAFDRPVNAVNARLLAQERGLTVVESVSSAPGAYASTVRVRTESKGERHEVVGTLLGDRGRFVELDGISLEAVPEGILLVVNNRDTPGVIGHMGTILGQAGINISRMHLGLDEGQALSLISIDSEASQEVLDAIGVHVTWVKQVHLN